MHITGNALQDLKNPASLKNMEDKNERETIFVLQMYR